MDAMNDLDDDLILETSRCRNLQRSGNGKLLFSVAVAAVFCVIASVFLAAEGFNLLAQNNENHVLLESSDLHFSVQDNSQQIPETTERSVQEVPSVIVTLDAWITDGFTGTVTGIVDTDVLPLGSRVAVKTDSKTILSAYSESETENKILTDTSSALPIVVKVMFRPLEEDDCSDFAEDADLIYHIYAEQVCPVENAAE